MAGRSEAYQRFIASMTVDFDKWHDGTGYDLQALAELRGQDRQDVESLLLSRAGGDWRDKEALAAIGSARAIRGLETQRTNGQTLRDRIDAASHLLEPGRIGEMAPLLCDALSSGGDDPLFSRALWT